MYVKIRKKERKIYMTKINEFGLYKNIISRRNMVGLKSGLYDDQTQGWWLPFYDEKRNLHLVDTYHINVFSNRNNEFLKNFIEENIKKKDNSWIINKSNFDYYYGGSIKVSEAIMPYFECVCDLRDFEISNVKPDDYLEQDVVTNVQLYFEHGYPHGVTLLRKGAKKDINRVARNYMYNLLDNADHWAIFDSEIDKLTEYRVDALIDKDLSDEIYITINYLKKIQELSNLKKQAREQYLQEIRKIRRSNQ